MIFLSCYIYKAIVFLLKKQERKIFNLQHKIFIPAHPSSPEVMTMEKGKKKETCSCGSGKSPASCCG